LYRYGAVIDSNALGRGSCEPPQQHMVELRIDPINNVPGFID